MQLRDQVSNAICELERLLGEHTRHLLLRGLHRAEAEREGLVERHRTAHRLRGQRRNLVTAAEVGGEVVDALGRDNGAVDVEADSLSSAQRGLRMRDAQPDARAHRERAAAEGRRSAKVKDLHKKWHPRPFTEVLYEFTPPPPGRRGEITIAVAVDGIEV